MSPSIAIPATPIQSSFTIESGTLKKRYVQFGSTKAKDVSISELMLIGMAAIFGVLLSMCFGVKILCQAKICLLLDLISCEQS